MKCWHMILVKDEVGLPVWKNCSREAKWYIDVGDDIVRSSVLCAQHAKLVQERLAGTGRRVVREA